MTKAAASPVLSLPRADPDLHGLDAAAVQAFVRAADAQQLKLHSLMIVRHGHVLAEGWWQPYAADIPHTVFSVSKSFTASAIGLAEAESLLSISEPVLEFFPGLARGRLQSGASSLTLEHLLTMATGHAEDTMAIMRALPGRDWVEVFFDVPLVYPAGTHFLYNSGASFVLSAALQARAGVTLDEYVRSRLLEPLGIRAPAWAASPHGISLGASGLRLLTEDLAKFGLLYLQGGRFGGSQVLPEDWVARATALHVATRSEAADWAQGYGYQFWRSTHDSYRADGAYGQFSLVLPEQDAVIAITAGNRDNWRIPPVLWEHLLPGFHPDSGAGGWENGLGRDLRGLAIPVPAFRPDPPAREAALTGQTVTVEPNVLGVRAIRFDAEPGAMVMTLTFADGSTESTPAGRAEWLPGSTALWPHDEPADPRIASSAGWTDEATLEVHQQCIGTAFRRVWQFRFGNGDDVSISVGLDMAYWHDRTEVIGGRMQPG
jgi:CubicO group peptidase (beta-lactamase class C family)